MFSSLKVARWRVIALLGLSAMLLLLTTSCDQANSADGPVTASSVTATGIPRLIDLGATSCIPCKMMAPILEELEKEYAGRMEVIFIDVWKMEQEAKRYGIQVIPTQIFYGADGRELHRHVGFIGKEDILATWKRLGYDFVQNP